MNDNQKQQSLQQIYLSYEQIYEELKSQKK